MNDLMYQRRGFGSHGRPDGLVNKQSPSMPAFNKGPKARATGGQTLLKGNNMQNNGTKLKPSSKYKYIREIIFKTRVGGSWEK